MAAGPKSASSARGLRPAQIVICPEGSSYDPTHNQCVAASAISAVDDPSAKGKHGAANGDSTVSVKCSFRNGWVAVLPVHLYPSDDSFLMQALIGLTEEPSFWQGQSEYADLEPYAARRCTYTPQRFNVPSGDYFVLVGEADAFQRRGTYDHNGYRRRVHTSAATPTDLSIRNSDLTLSFSCISCPFVSFLDGSGHLLPAFVVLAYRSGKERRGTDRIHVRAVPVHEGKLRLRVAEADHEVSHLDQLVIDTASGRLLPTAGGERSALAFADGAGVDLARGRQIWVEFEVPGIREGAIDVDVVATGFYDPVE